MQFIQRAMYGRNGTDQLCFFLIGVYVVLSIILSFFDLGLLNLLPQILLFWSLFRMLSKNLTQRRAENTQFLQMVNPILRWFQLQKYQRSDRDHRYFKCPNCGQQLRAPRGKGKITVHCRNCGVSFDEKT